MRIAIVGKGNVGQAVAPRLKRLGHDTFYAVRAPAGTPHDGVPVRPLEAASDGDIILLAVPWPAAFDALDRIGSIRGKILVDCTNALDFQRNLAWLIPSDTSAAALIADRTEATVVKAFNQVGAATMAQVESYRVRPLQFAASDDDAAKQTVLRLMDDFGFDARDAGTLDAARDLESLARLWIAQAFGGMAPDRAWALVERA